MKTIQTEITLNSFLTDVLIDDVVEVLAVEYPGILQDIVSRRVYSWGELTISEIATIFNSVPIPHRDKAFNAYSTHDIRFGDAFKKKTYEKSE